MTTQGNEDTQNEQEYPVSAEAAEAEWKRWLVAMDLVDKADESFMDQEDLKGFREQKRRIIDAIRRGRLRANDAGEFVFSPQSGTCGDITFHEPTGADKLAVDRCRKNEDMAKTYAVLASMTGTSPQTFAGLKGRDLRVCEAIFVLFLA